MAIKKTTKRKMPAPPTPEEMDELFGPPEAETPPEDEPTDEELTIIPPTVVSYNTKKLPIPEFRKKRKSAGYLA